VVSAFFIKSISKQNQAMIFMKIIAVFVFVTLVFNPVPVSGQIAIAAGDTITRDTVRMIKNPKVATILSAVLPGAGQIYNEKVWKVPILYGGIITNIYFAEFNNRRYQLFREALFAFDRQDPNPRFPNLNRDALVRNVNYWRRNRDLVFILFGAIYALNIVDAQVDAHLSGFDVSEDLTLFLEPSYESLTAGSRLFGMSLKLKF
jgi:hypothetical protein